MKYLASIIFLLSMSVVALACICERGTIQDNFTDSEWVLRVKALHIDNVPKNRELKKNGYNKVHFKILEEFKSNGIIASFNEPGHSCGFPSHPGWEMIIFVNSDGWVSACSMSTVNDPSDPESSAEFDRILTQLREIPNSKLKNDAKNPRLNKR